MWTCTKCGREFKRKDQQHSCRLISSEVIFSKHPPELKKIYVEISRIVKSFGDYREEAVPPDVIFFKTESTFLGIKVKKDHLEVEFFLDRLENVPAVSKYLQTSKHRVAHVVPVDSIDEIDAQLKEWMKFSYELIQRASANNKRGLRN